MGSKLPIYFFVKEDPRKQLLFGFLLKQDQFSHTTLTMQNVVSHYRSGKPPFKSGIGN